MNWEETYCIKGLINEIIYLNKQKHLVPTDAVVGQFAITQKCISYSSSIVTFY